MNDTTVGDRLKELRELHHYSQEQLANMLGVSRKTISNYESDSRELSNVMLLRLASIYRVTTDYILGRQKTDLLDISDLSQREVSVMQELAELLGEKYK